MDLENILYRIINGYYTIVVDNTIYRIVFPNINIKQQAHQIYLNIMDEHKYDINSWISESAVNNLLKIYNIWNNTLEDKYNSLLKDLDKSKIELFRNYFNDLARSSIKDLITNINTTINNMFNKKHYFDYLTLEYYAQNIKNQFLITNMVYTIDNTKVFNYDTFDDIDSVFLEKILFEIHKNTIDQQTIKQLARHDCWRSFWNIAKEKVFSGSVRDWTDEQRSLVNFSKVLDSIREHYEAPSEEILLDDDALDGWILYQNEKHDKERKTKQINEKFGLDKKRGDEVFVITQDANEKKIIQGLNDAQTNNDIKRMIELSHEKGEINWSDLPHVQRDIKQQIMQKGRK